ncbi:MAG: YebC/PmpR family DNA-binding transcriptional regulator [Campylobacterales bacterium]|nr:YebC/PmpR family DNA-binding transcriptional regulator [Campylobacterales bacterium]
MGRAFEYRKAAKMKRWGNMSRIFPKLGRAITVAAKEGVPDPAMNAKLRAAIANAKAEGMPKDNIDAAIKRASGRDAVDYTEIVYDGKGPHGTLFMIECATDNPTRTIANVRAIFTKAGGQIVPSGSLDFMFSRKSVFEFEKPSMDLEELELSLIDAGLEEMTIDEDTVYVYGDYTNFGSLATALEELKIEVKKSALERVPTSPIDVTDEQMAEIEKIIEKIEDDDDVQAVFTNLA